MAENPVFGWDERDEVLRRRYQEARAAGLTDRQAKKFSESARDVGELRRVVGLGCPPHLVARIVL